MATRYRFTFLIIVVVLVGVLLTGCGPRALTGNFEFLAVEDVESAVVVRPIRYVDGYNSGPIYNFSITVPEGWVDRFETENTGNSVTFNFIPNPERNVRAPIFSIEALSEAQYWEQIGSYPGDYENIVNTADTYFIYHLPLTSYFSGLDDEEFAAFAEAVPAIIDSFAANLAARRQ